MKYAFKAKNFTISLVAYTLYTVSYSLAGASAIYFMKDVLRVSEQAIILPNILNMAFSLLSMPLWLKFGRKKLGQKKMYALGLIWMGLAYIPVLWYTDYMWAPILASIGAIGFGCFTVMVMPVVSDCYDEVSTITGKHQEAVLLGIRNFFIRISIIAQTLIMAITHQITNYNPDPLALQTDLAIIGIRITYGLFPALCLFVAAFVMLMWYDLEGERKQAVLDKLRELKI
jgi:Na+/melibiose symporter-like transporter